MTFESGGIFTGFADIYDVGLAFYLPGS